MKLLVIEDSSTLRANLETGFRRAGFAVDVATDGGEGLRMALATHYDVVLLDLGLPVLDGMDVLRRLREEGNPTHVLALTARDALEDRVRGLDGGADDYVVKPFSMKELLLRIRAVLQRAEGATPGLARADGKARIGRAMVDFAAYTVEKDGARQGLSKKELELLRFFLAHEGKAVTRDAILSAVWGADEFPTTRTIDMHVLKLRKKLEDDPETPRLFLTLHGVGYRFVRDGGAR